MQRRVTYTIVILLAGILIIAIMGCSANNDIWKHVVWGLIGNDGLHLEEEFQAGIRVKLFRLSWREFFPQEGVIDWSYVAQKRSELNQLYDAGFGVVLSFGAHDTPAWIHENYTNTYYINQFGERYLADFIDSGDANLIFNPELRQLADQYVDQVFSLFGDAYVGVRIGGGRYGEVGYPPANYNNRQNQYWVFDENALERLPILNWRPGDPSPEGEAQRFLDWQIDQLLEYQQWQIDQVRAHYDGLIMLLFPSWGIRPGDKALALQGNLSGDSSAEQHGEVQRGFDFAQMIGAITDPNVVVTTTWLDADPSNDDVDDQRYWSPVKYLDYLAAQNPLPLKLYGENTGQGSREAMLLSAAQMEKYGLIGMLWYREEEMLTGNFATLNDYAEVIRMFSDN